MHTLDLALLVPITLGFVFGLFKGLIKELTSLAAILLGIYGAKLFAPFISNFLIHKLNFSVKTALPLAYFFLFVAIAFGLLLVAKMLDKIFDSMSLGGINKLLGGVFGALKYALIVSVLLNVFDALDSRFTIIKPKTKEESIGYKPLLKFGPTLWDEAKRNKQDDDKRHSTIEDRDAHKRD
ncbi:MAG: CvpA family protein [Bacteroidota bacterium]|nr:CvpA family protein [Bacteroidota bacterium]